MKPKTTHKCQNSNKDCFANARDGLCYALSDTTFLNRDGSKRECPFYKPATKKR